MFQHREAKDRLETPAAELLIDFFERLGQIEHQIDARPFFHIDADILALAAKPRPQVLRIAVVFRSDFQKRPLKRGGMFLDEQQLIGASHGDLRMKFDEEIADKRKEDCSVITESHLSHPIIGINSPFPHTVI